MRPVERGNRRLTPAQAKSLVEDYKAGETLTNCCIRYGISRTSLYRHLKAYKDKYGEGEKPITFYKVELQRLKDVLADVMVENAELKKRLHERR